MNIYEVVLEEKITKLVCVTVEANSEEEAMDKACSNEIKSMKTLNVTTDEYVPLETFEIE